ncbi:MAG: hypothetical protein JXQ76_03600 [Campylobacterales bacterium]|nr:hypothetical protein [Campylobacterales bacterium]
MFKRTLIYIKIYKNRVVLKNIDTQRVIAIDDCAFSTNRYLIAEFTKLSQALEPRLKEILKRYTLLTPFVVMHPIEMVDAELCEIERQIFSELIQNTFRTQPLFWIGNELNDDEVKQYILQEKY